MRKIYFFVIAAFAMLQATTLNAQDEVIVYNGHTSMHIPKILTKENKPFYYLVKHNSNYIAEQAIIYDAEFKQVTNINFKSDSILHIQRKEERKIVDVIDSIGSNVSPFDIVSAYEELLSETINRKNLTINRLIELWKEIPGNYYWDYNDFIIESSTDSSAIFYPNKNDENYFYHPNYFGMKYPKVKIILNIGNDITKNIQSKYIENEWKHSYTGEWETIVDTLKTRYVSIMDFFVDDYDNNEINSDKYMYITQTLLNDDEKFEYITPVYDETIELVDN
ncbi:MAG: hypothetical protein E7089_03770 [Bacteroidales bacterium]|nr:hypothetical protein [Bacteroidales bacterium]